MSVVIDFSQVEGVRVERNRMDFTVGSPRGDNCYRLNLRSPSGSPIVRPNKGETEGTWLQLLRSCALHLLHRSNFKGAEVKSETEQESELIENEVERNRNN